MIELWYRFNLFAEKKFFDRKSVDGLIVPANLIAYYEIAMPELLRDINLPFIIDPVTYVWGLEKDYLLDEGELKKSFGKLAKKLDCSTASLLGRGQIQTIKEESPEFGEFVEKVLLFQLFTKSAEKLPRQQSMERMKRFRMKVTEQKQDQIRPYALVPPYFYFTNILGNPYNKTVCAARLAKDSKYGKSQRIYPCICMDKALLTEGEQLKQIIDDFKDYAGIILWISNFDETKASLDELKNLVSFVRSFSERQTEVINFYGGYFSLMLSYVGLSKLSCGICYSNFRDVTSQASGGGLPIRYYEPNLKIKLLGDDMFKLYSDIREFLTCNCPTCSSYIEKIKQAGNGDDKEQLLKEFFGIYRRNQVVKSGIINWETSRLHFLHCRKMEQSNLMEKSMAETVSNLEATYKLLLEKHLDPSNYRFISFEYLKLWADSLKTDLSRTN